MQRRFSTLMMVLLMVMASAGSAWAGNDAAKMASAELDKGFQAAKRGYWNEAMARYLNASKNVPGSAEIWNNLGVALEAVGQYAEAGDAYRRALEIDPSNRDIHKNYGLYNDFYMTYIVRPEPEAEEHEAGKDDQSDAKSPDEDEATDEDEDQANSKGADDASHQ